MNKNLKIALISISAFVVTGIIVVVALIGVGYLRYNGGLKEISYSDSGVYPSYDMGMYQEEYVTSDNYFESNVESKIKKNGDINLLVDSLEDSSNTVLSLLSEYSGELVSSYESGSGNDRYFSMTLKVESSKFEDIYAKLRDIGVEVLYSSYSTEDVTMEYTDLESTLRNLKATEAQLLKVLGEADTVTDTLAVYTELTNIRSQIEVAEGRVKYLDSQVDYSYITVTLSLSDSGMDIVSSKWQPLGVFKSALSALVGLGKGLANVLIWILVFSPVGGAIYGLVVLVKRSVKKKA